MSQIICIGTESGKYIEEDLGGNRFKNHIILDWCSELIPHSSFLNEEQIDTLSPDYDLDDDSIVTLRDAEALKECFILLKEYLFENQNNLPIGHWIESSLNCWNGRSRHFVYNNNDCHLEGLHDSLEERDCLQLIWNIKENDKWITCFEWVKAKSLIVFGDFKFKIHSQNWYDEFSSILGSLIKFCEEAEKNNEKILWTIE